MLQVTGRVSALSHILRMLNDRQWFIELQCEDGRQIMMVKEPKAQEWHHHIELDGCYTFTCVHWMDIDVGDHCMQILSTCCQTTLCQLTDEQVAALKHQLKGRGKEMQHKVLSCKAEVSEVINEEAGIYLLSNGMKLYITFLQDVTEEFWNDDRPTEGLTEELNPTKTFTEETKGHPSIKKQNTLPLTSKTDKINVRKCLSVGDTLRITRCHYIRKEKQVTLVCCGQSYLMNQSRRFVLKPLDSQQTLPLITEATHSLNLTFSGLLWLLKLKEHFLTTLPLDGFKSDSCHKMLKRLFSEAKSRNLMNGMQPRSLVREFLHPTHQCELFKDVVPQFELVSLKNCFPIQDEINARTNSNQDQDSWNSSNRSNSVNQHSCDSDVFWRLWLYPECKQRGGGGGGVVVGRLGGGDGGVLQLSQNGVTVDLVIVGNAGMSLTVFGAIVALFNYRIAKEDFHVLDSQYSANLDKTYVVVKASDVVVLEESQPQLSSSRETNAEKYSYKLRLLSKSALLVPHSTKPNVSEILQHKFFLGMANFMKVGQKGEVENWQRYVKFTGHTASLYPLLEVGDECDIQVTHSHNTEALLKQINMSHSIGSLSKHQTADCLTLHPEIKIRKVSSKPLQWGEISVQEAVRQGDESELITITGIVVFKTFMTPRFESEMSRLPNDMCNKSHLGVPKSMQMRIQIRDENECSSKIWLYMSFTTSSFITVYSLFVIPGIKIIATDVKRMVSHRTKNVYLVSSGLTRIVPLSIPGIAAPGQGKKIPGLAVPSQENERPGSLVIPAQGSEIPGLAIPVQGNERYTSLEPEYHTLMDVGCECWVVFARVDEVVYTSFRMICGVCHVQLQGNSQCCWNCFSESSGIIETCVKILIDDGTDTASIMLTHLKHFAILLRLKRKDYMKLCSEIVSQCLHLEYVSDNARCGQPRKCKSKCCEDFCNMMERRELEHSYKFTCRKGKSQEHLCLDVAFSHSSPDLKIVLKNNSS